VCTCDLLARSGDVLDLPDAQLSPLLLGCIHQGLAQLLGVHLGCAALIPHWLHHTTPQLVATHLNLA